MSITLKEAVIGFMAALLAGLLVLAAERYLSRPSQQTGTVLYQIASSTITPEAQERVGLGKADDLKSIHFLRIDFYNTGNKDLIDFELAVPGFSDRKHPLKFGFSADGVILAEPLSERSIDENGVLRLKVKKFENWRNFSLDAASSTPFGVYSVESITQGISSDRLSSLGFNSRSNSNSFFTFIVGGMAVFAALAALSLLVKHRESTTTTDG